MTILLSSGLSPLAGTPALIGLTLFGLSACWAILPPGPLPGGMAGWLGGLGLMVGSALGHELGHAAALRREGLPPGRIGAGILFVIPVLWADVTAAQALPRAGRLRVDLAGVCFQVAAAGVLAVAGRLAGPAGPACELAALGALAACAWSLIPFLRTDGYWALADLLGLDSLERPPLAGSSRALAWFVASYRLVNGAFLVALVGLLPRRIFGLADRVAALVGLDPHATGVRAAALLVCSFLLAGLVWSVKNRLIRLARPH